MKETITEKFAGPYDRGEFSPSVQKTLYDSQVLILQRIPEVRLRLFFWGGGKRKIKQVR